MRLAIRAVMLPVSNPVNKHLPNLHVGNGHLFDGVHLECWSVEHFLYCARSGLENSKGDELVKSKLNLFGYVAGMGKIACSMLMAYFITIIGVVWSWG